MFMGKAQVRAKTAVIAGVAATRMNVLNRCESLAA
jgi:hypothetical protein